MNERLVYTVHNGLIPERRGRVPDITGPKATCSKKSELKGQNKTYRQYNFHT